MKKIIHILVWEEELDEENDRELINECLKGNKEAILINVPMDGMDTRIILCHSNIVNVSKDTMDIRIILSHSDKGVKEIA